MEMTIRELCIVHFPGLKSLHTPDVHLRSLTARMWHARRSDKIDVYCLGQDHVSKLAQ